MTPNGRVERLKGLDGKHEVPGMWPLCHIVRWGVALNAWLRRPDADVATFTEALGRTNGHAPFGTDILEQILVEAKYRGYMERQARQIERFRRLESLAIPASIDYASLSGVRLEAREHLARVGPRTLGQAARISGINPADINVLSIYLVGRGRSAEQDGVARSAVGVREKPR